MPGMLTVHVCVAWMRVLFGMLTCMPFVVGVLSRQGEFVWRKWPVQPVSAKALLIGE